jgi:hypothetical protein
LADSDAAGRLAEDSDLVWITAKRRNVLLDPLQTRNHIEQAVVARDMLRRLCAQLRMREKAERAQAIGDADQHNSLLCQSFSAVSRNSSASYAEAAAVDPNQHRDTVRGRFRRSPHIQI